MNTKNARAKPISRTSVDPAPYRIGIGHDTHRLVPKKILTLGGVVIPSSVGAVAHSDGDALLHALTDALLGAAGAGDIGDHFPDTHPKWKGAASGRFVKGALDILARRGYRPANVDAIVFLERPKLAAFKRAIAANIARLLGLPADAVNVKAKTGEGVGAVGKGQLVAAQAAILARRMKA